MGRHAGFIFLVVLCVGRLVSSEALVEVAEDSFPSCSLCNNIVSVAASTPRRGAHREQSLTILRQVCESYQTPRGIQRCSQFVERFGLLALDYLASGEIPQRVCAYLSACPSENVGRPKIPSVNNALPNKAVSTFLKEPVAHGYKADARCELCKFFVQLIDNTLQKPPTVAAVNATLEAICASLTDPTLKLLCQTLDSEVIQLVKTGLNPVTSCQATDFCPRNHASTRYEIDVSRVPGLTCDTCNGIVEQLAITLNVINEELESVCLSMELCPEEESWPERVEPQPHGSVVQSQYDEQSTLACEICELLIDTADQYLKNNKSEAAINATIYKICNDLPATLKPLCLGYAPAIVAALADGFDPKKVCVVVKLCTGNGTVPEIPQKLAKPAVHNTLECEICELLINLADQYLQKNRSEAAVNTTIYNICNDLPATFKPLCLSFAPQIVAALVKGLDPTKVCSYVKLCTGNGTSANFLTKLTQKPTDKEEDSLECELCEFILTQADNFLKNKNFTPAEVNNTIFGLCNNLPISFQPFCDYYAKEIVQLIVDGVDPGKVCVEIKLCSSGTGQREIPERRPKAFRHKQPRPTEDEVSGLECELCEFVIAQADAYLKNKNFTPAEVNSTVYKLCGDLPPAFQGFCYQYAPEIVKVLEEGVDPKEACVKIKLCTSLFLSKTQNTPPKLAEKVSGLECELCEFVIAQADAYLKNKNFTPAEVNSTVYKLCGDLPPAFQGFCYQYAPEIVKVLEEGVDPKEACIKIKLCTSLFHSKTQNTSPKLAEKVSGLECQLCEFVIAQADAYLKNKNFTPAEVNSTVYKLCGDLPPAFQGFCYQYAPEIVKVLEEGVDPKEACIKIKLCTSLFHSKTQNTSPKLAEKVSGLECELCEFVIAQADAYLKNKNFTPAEVNSTVYKLCGDLPPAFQGFCYQYAPEIVKVLEEGVDPKEACVKIKLCTSLFFSRTRSTPSKLAEKSSECDLCMFVMEAVDFYLKGKNMTLAEANRTVFGICDMFPESYRGFCYSQAPGIAKFLADGADPNTVCSKLDLCATRQTGRSLQGVIECDACKILFASLDDDLYRDEKKVQDLLDKVCHRLPPPTDKQCLGLVDPNFDALWDKFLSKVLSPDGVCKLLKLCK